MTLIGITFICLLMGLLGVTLKLFGVTHASWWWVVSPWLTYLSFVCLWLLSWVIVDGYKALMERIQK
jgi:hypothetical protein